MYIIIVAHEHEEAAAAEVVAMNALSDLFQATNAPLVLCPNLERFE